MKIPKKQQKKINRENTIIKFCLSEKKHFSEIVKHLDNINIHTLRSKYLYPLVKEGRLKKIPGRWYLSNNIKN